MTPGEQAVLTVERKARSKRADAASRIDAVFTAGNARTPALPADLSGVGRLTMNFHPDRIAADGQTVAAGLASTGRYLSQWVTWISAGSRSALPTGMRAAFESALFGDAYSGKSPDEVDFPLYGTLDLLQDPHGGAPRFGSCFVVLEPYVYSRCTFSVGDSHLNPTDVGARGEILSLAAGLAEQAGSRHLLGRGLGLDALRAILNGFYVPGGPHRDLDNYVEMQVHGGVDLGTDVAAIVADPSFKDTAVHADLQLAADAFGFDLEWHDGSALHVDAVPADFRGPGMPALARQVAGDDGMLTARHIGEAAAVLAPTPPTPKGDPEDGAAQQLKKLWHTLLAFGS